MDDLDMEVVDMSISMTPNAHMCAEDPDALADYFQSLIKTEMDVTEGTLNLRTITQNVNDKLFAKFGPLFYMRAIDDDTEEPPSDDATEVTLILDTLRPYNNTVH
jgi:hypothetical protein